MILLAIIIKVVAFVIFCLVSSFVILFGKNNTGIKSYYAFTAVFLWGVMLYEVL